MSRGLGLSHLLDSLGLAPFRERFPWLGPDLQMLRNTLRGRGPLPETGLAREFPLPDGDRLLARLDAPLSGRPRGLVLVLHGLGGSSDDEGQRRLSRALVAVGFAALRLNLRGAGPGRALARGTYAASCGADLLPVLRACRRVAEELAPAAEGLPLGAVGLSLGGTVLLNALLAANAAEPPLLEALVCVSSPLDLAHCADLLDRPRNRLYQRWMVRRLIAQTLADPHGLSERERQGLEGPGRPRTIREFDGAITAPRWGFADVGAYYEACSPLPRLRQLVGEPHGAGTLFPSLLVVQAEDDPWVPVASARSLAEAVAARQASGAARTDAGAVAGAEAVGAGAVAVPEVLITARGGHNGFHAPGDTFAGCWSDRLAALWLAKALSSPTPAVNASPAGPP